MLFKEIFNIRTLLGIEYVIFFILCVLLRDISHFKSKILRIPFIWTIRIIQKDAEVWKDLCLDIFIIIADCSNFNLVI